MKKEDNIIEDKDTNPRLHIYYPIFQEFRLKATTHLLECIKKEYPNHIEGKFFNLSNIEDQEQICRLDVGDYVITPTKRFLDCRNEYFYDKHNEYIKQLNTNNKTDFVTMDSNTVRHIYNKMFCVNEEDTFINTFIKYIRTFDLPQNIKSKQIKYLLEKSKRKTDEEINYTLLVDEFKNRITDGSVWWFYFYGYDKENKEYWRLMKLVLTFKSGKQNDFIVKIQNNENSKHNDYIGKTDFSSSTLDVLVMNLKTVKQKKRQLNIKMLVNGAKDRLFIGQYLNYEITPPRIISGIVVMEMVENDDEPIPDSYNIPNEGELPQNLQRIQHIIEIFKNKTQIFRATPA